MDENAERIGVSWRRDASDAAPPVNDIRETSGGIGTLVAKLPDSIARVVFLSALLRCRPISLILRLRRVNKHWRDLISTTVEWVALEFTRLDASGYVHYAEAQRRKWWVRFWPRTRHERFTHEVDHLYAVLGEKLWPIGLLTWCTGSKVDVYDPELDYYAKVAMELSDKVFLK